MHACPSHENRWVNLVDNHLWSPAIESWHFPLLSQWVSIAAAVKVTKNATDWLAVTVAVVVRIEHFTPFDGTLYKWQLLYIICPWYGLLNTAYRLDLTLIFKQAIAEYEYITPQFCIPAVRPCWQVPRVQEAVPQAGSPSAHALTGVTTLLPVPWMRKSEWWGGDWN